MGNLLEITFYDDNTKAKMSLLGQNFGPYTLAEKLIQQITDFYNDKVITLEETKNHINNFLKNSDLKSNNLGGFSIFFQIYTFLPDVPISIAPVIESGSSIHFAFIESSMRYVFVLRKNNEDILLSSYFQFKQEAYDFLNFLFVTEVITHEDGEALEKLITDSILYDGNKISLSN